MNFFETIRISLDALLVNRLRAVLTTLGIIIGVGAVIGLVSLGRGVENYIGAQFQALGSNVLFVFSSPPTSGTRTTIQPLTTLEAADLSNPAIAPSIRQVAMEIAKKQGVDGYITTADELAFPRLMFSIDSNLRQLNTLLARFASLVDDANASGRAVDTLALLSKAVASVTNKPESENPFLWSDEFLGERVAAAMNRRAR